MHDHLKFEMAVFCVAKLVNRMAIDRVSRLEDDHFFRPAEPRLNYSEVP